MLLAIDVGTSSTRAIVYSDSGALISEGNRPLKMSFPQNGWVEQCPNEMWEMTLEAIKLALTQKNLNVADIKACGISNQRETTIVWNKSTGEVLAPAIVWQDRRTNLLCQRFSECEALVFAKTGLVLDPYFSATKLLWLKENNSCVQAAMEKGECLFGTVDTFILWRLTKGLIHRTDASNASRTMLVNLKTGQWDNDLLKLFSIPREVLPDICDSNAHFGNVDKSWFGTSIPVTGILGDQQAASLGQCCFSKGESKITFGTGCFSMLNTGSKPIASNHQLLSTILYQIDGQKTYALEGSLFNAGTTVRWLREKLEFIESAKESESFARELTNNQGVFFVPAFTGLGAPFWEPNVRASFVGLQLSTDKKIMVRAVLESICYQVKALMEAKNKDFGGQMFSMKVDGGMTVNNWLMQYLANCLSLTIKRRSISEVTAWGVAMLASFGAGQLSSLQAIREFDCEDRVFVPNNDCSPEQNNYQQWLKAVNATITFSTPS